MDTTMQPEVKDLDNSDLERAYMALPLDERILLDKQADALENGIKLRRKGAQFGHKQALEVLAKLGIWKIRQSTPVIGM
jgi:hypothetical protein